MGEKLERIRKRIFLRFFFHQFPLLCFYPSYYVCSERLCVGGWGVKSVSGLFPTYSQETNEDCAAQPKIYKQKDKCLHFVNRFLLLFGNSPYKYLWNFLLVFLLSPPPSQRAFNKPCVIIYVNSGFFSLRSPCFFHHRLHRSLSCLIIVLSYNFEFAKKKIRK